MYSLSQIRLERVQEIHRRGIRVADLTLELLDQDVRPDRRVNPG